MFYWRVRAGIRNEDIDMNTDVIQECIVALVHAKDSNEAIDKFLNTFPQYNLFITSVQLANNE